MKRITYLLSFVTIAFMYYGCDKVDPPYREEVVTPDFCATGIDDSIPNKKVLVEEFTGHLCGQCPPAGKYLNDTLHPIYNHCLISISIHAGFFAGICPSSTVCQSLPSGHPSNSFTTDFSCAVGNAWYSGFGVSTNPTGMVNRAIYPSGRVLTYNAWASAIATALQGDAKATLKITNSYNATNRNVSVAVDSKFVNQIQGDYKLQVVITEDSVVDWQLWYNHNPEYVPDYLHRHVLRDALNTTWGETIVSGTINGGTTITKNYNYTINNAWNAAHCSIVAFIYDDNTKEVLQVEEAAVQ